MWWLVTPGNPLKDTRGLQPLEDRIAASRKLTNHPRIDVTGLEAVINTRYTYDTLEFLVRRCPGVRFVWVMGADNLRSFSPLAKLARHRQADADGGGRPHGIEPVCHRRAAPPRRSPRYRLPERLCAGAGRPEAAGLDLPPRPQVAAVLDGASGAANRQAQPLKSARILQAYL